MRVESGVRADGISDLGYFGVIDDRLFDNDGLGLERKFEKKTKAKCPPEVRVRKYGRSFDKKNATLRRLA